MMGNVGMEVEVRYPGAERERNLQTAVAANYYINHKSQYIINVIWRHFVFDHTTSLGWQKTRGKNMAMIETISLVLTRPS